MDGRKKKLAHLHGLELVAGDGGKGDAHGEVGGDEDQRHGQQQDQAADHRHVEEEAGADEDQPHLDVADEDVGNDLADQHLERPRGHGEQVLHRAALALAGDRQGGDHDHGHREDDAEQAGDDVVLRDRFGVVEGVDAQVNRAVRPGQESERPLEVVLQRAVEQQGQGAERVAGGGRVGGVGLDEDGGPVAAQQVAREILRDVDDELDFAAGQGGAPWPIRSPPARRSRSSRCCAWRTAACGPAARRRRGARRSASASGRN